MAEEPSLSYYLPIAGGRIIGFIPFPRVLVLCEMQSVSSRIWTRIAVFISYGNNDYTTGTSDGNGYKKETPYSPKPGANSQCSLVSYRGFLIWMCSSYLNCRRYNCSILGFALFHQSCSNKDWKKNIHFTKRKKNGKNDIAQ